MNQLYSKEVKLNPFLIWDSEYCYKPGVSENVDMFIQTTAANPLDRVTPQGTNDTDVLAMAPSPEITIAGVKKKAGIVVDIGTNILYRYDENGNPISAYQIASGKKSTPTDKGVRIVTHKETYPYREHQGDQKEGVPQKITARSSSVLIR